MAIRGIAMRPYIRFCIIPVLLGLLAFPARAQYSSGSDLSSGPSSVVSATTVVSIPIQGYYSVGATVTAIGSSNTIIAEESKDGGTTWTQDSLWRVSTSTVVSSISAVDQFTLLCSGGASNVRIRVSSYGSGAVTASLRATQTGNPLTYVSQSGSGWSTNLAQVNAITVLTGTGAVGTGSQRVAVGTDTATIAGSAPGTAGTASANVVTVQGIASMTKLLVTPDSVALPANQSVNVSQVNATTILTGTGAVGTGSQRVAVGTDTATIAGSAPGTAGTASANVVTVQGIASMTAVKVDGSGVTQPVSETAAASGGYSFLNMTTKTTTTLKSGAGTLHTVTINSKGAVCTATLYDNTAASGTSIATIDTTLGQDTLTFDCAFTTGLTCIIAGTTAPDITITYKLYNSASDVLRFNSHRRFNRQYRSIEMAAM